MHNQRTYFKILELFCTTKRVSCDDGITSVLNFDSDNLTFSEKLCAKLSTTEMGVLIWKNRSLYLYMSLLK